MELEQLCIQDEYLSDDIPNRAGQDEDGEGYTTMLCYYVPRANLLPCLPDEYAKQQREADMAAAQALPANVKSVSAVHRIINSCLLT